MLEIPEFISAIVADPDDDLPRLIYADWLDERGDPRGQFIRDQIRLLHGEPLSEIEQDRMAGSERRLARTWAGRISELAYVVNFRRGFPESLILPASIFVERAAEIFRLAPIRRVTLIGARAVMRFIVRLPYLERLTALHLTGGSLGDAEVEKLADSPHICNLQTLRLGSNGITSGGLAALATSRHLRKLRQLDLNHNEIGDWGARVLAEAPRLGNLEHLDLSHNELSDTGVTFLRQSRTLTGLRHLDVSMQRLGDGTDSQLALLTSA